VYCPNHTRRDLPRITQGNRPMFEAIVSNPYALAIILGFAAWIAADLI